MPTHGPYTYKKLLNIYKYSNNNNNNNKNNNNNNKILQSKIEQTNVIPISAIAKCESEYKQWEACIPL